MSETTEPKLPVIRRILFECIMVAFYIVFGIKFILYCWRSF